MPKILKKPGKAAEPPKAANLAELGQIVALADLAQAEGVTVEACCGFPAKLAAAGLPANPSTYVRKEAHKLYRDRIDAVLWRMDGRTILEAANLPELTAAQVNALIGKVERQAAVAPAAAPRLSPAQKEIQAKRIAALAQATENDDEPIDL